MIDPRTNLVTLASRFEAVGQEAAAAYVRSEIARLDVELQLVADRVLFGNSFCLETPDPASPTGVRRQRLDPLSVTFAPETHDV